MTATPTQSLPAREAPVSRATARRQALKVSLIDAAESTIASKGLPGLNARDLAREVGCALGAIYNVFPHLDAIVFEVNGRTLILIEKFIARRAKAAAAKSPEETLIELALAYLDFAVANRPRWRAMFEHNPEAPGSTPASYRAEQGRIFGMVEEPLSLLRPDLSQDELVLLGRTIFSAVHGIVVLSLDEKLLSLPIATVRKQVREFVRLLGVALSASAAGRPGRR